ncbi:hypothetical protein F5146DRAFT_685979 [Armillaria mellea]|nr:hypothetical protein F5146DRAFT_685979 [Armillaria mellea]
MFRRLRFFCFPNPTWCHSVFGGSSLPLASLSALQYTHTYQSTISSPPQASLCCGGGASGIRNGRHWSHYCFTHAQ